MRSWLAAVFFAHALATAGCHPSGVTPPRIEDPTPLSKCQVAKSVDSPLVTEWPASEKAHLESLLISQAVVVAHEGCELRVLEHCRPEGRYAFQRTSLSTDTIEITDAEELYAKLPFGAAALEGELEVSGRLVVHTTAVGQVRLTGEIRVPRTPACQGATHVVRAISVGAYDMTSGGSVAGGAGISAGPVGAGAHHRASRRLLRSSGDPARCAETTAEPHADCRSPIQLFLTPVVWGWSNEPVPGADDEPVDPPPVVVAPRPGTGSVSPAPPPARPAHPQAAAVPPEPRPATPSSSPARCEDATVKVLSVTPHTRGSRVRLAFHNPTADDLQLPGSGKLHILDSQGTSYTPLLVPADDLWFHPVVVPSEATQHLEVVVGSGLRADDVAQVRIRGIEVLHGHVTWYGGCDLRVELSP